MVHIFDVLAMTAGRLITRLGGRYGEALSGRLISRVPSRLLASSGQRNARRLGFLWTLDLADNLQRNLYFTGSYESPVLRELKSRLRPDDVVLDVGANVGTFTLPVAAMLGEDGRVVAVEPAADTAGRLRGHVRANGLERRVTVVEAALSEHPGQAVLRCGAEMDTGLRGLDREGGPVGKPVRVTTVDLLCGELGVARIDVLKVDVEGHERAVLAGMAETLRRSPPRLVVLEVNSGFQERAWGSTAELLSTLTDHGYHGRAIRYRGLRRLDPAFRGNALFQRAAVQDSIPDPQVPRAMALFWSLRKRAQ